MIINNEVIHVHVFGARGSPALSLSVCGDIASSTGSSDSVQIMTEVQSHR